MGIGHGPQAIHGAGRTEKPQALPLRLQTSGDAQGHGKWHMPHDGLRTADTPMGARWHQGKPRGA